MMKKTQTLIGATLFLGILSAPASAQHKPNPEPAWAVAPAAPSPDPRNLDGTWIRPRVKFDPEAMKKTGSVRMPPPPPQMTPAGQAWVDKEEGARKAGKPLPDAAVLCAPTGPTRLAHLSYPFQIISTPGQISILYEHNRGIRMIYMDEKHPDPPPPPTWMGHSVGHWEGDTLVVDTIAFRSEQELFPSLPQTEKTHLVERIRKLDGGQALENVMTIDDPAYYTKPWNLEVKFAWTPGYYDRVGEYICEEADTVESDNAKAFHSVK